MTPEWAAAIALHTSGRRYAWYVLDSPEGCYAVRAPPRNGLVVRLDVDAIAAWLRPRLTGNPPHKIAAAEYLAHLRSLGLEIVAEPREGADAELRFNLYDAMTVAERARELATLRRLTPADFEALDWAEYDREAASAACRLAYEVAGDVVIDLAAKTVAAPKVRPGTIWGTRPHQRSYVTFHTHPAGRYRGASAECPSVPDILNTLQGCAHDAQAWAFVSAPEGTYILRPSQALAAAYLRDPPLVDELVTKIYLERVSACADATAVCAGEAVRALEDAGFIAHLRGAPCTPLLAVPDLVPVWNLRGRGAIQASFAALAATPPAELLAADWAPAAALAESPTVRATTWLTADLVEGRAVPNGHGHVLDAANDANAYPNMVPGPLFIIYFPDEGGFPVQIPHVALSAVHRNAALWAWAVFLSPSRVTVFRAGADGIEVHGPAPRRPAPAKNSGPETRGSAAGLEN